MPRTGGSATSATRIWRKARIPGSNRVWCAAILGCACATPIHAEFDYLAGLSFAHNSNIGRVETNPQSEWTRALMAGLLYRENTVEVTARVLAQVESRHFYRHTFRDDTGAFLDGAMVWTILPRRLAWTVEDIFREVQVDIAAPNTPSNLTKSNSLSIGPDVIFPFSSTNSLLIGGRYGRFDIENSTNDSRRYTGYVRGVHALSAETKLSVNYEAGLVHFDPAAQAPKILREDWFGRYESRSTANSTTIDLGTSRATLYGGASLEPSRLARLTLSKAFSSQSFLRLSLSDQISDTYSDLIAGVTGSTAPRDLGVAVFNGVAFASGDVYHSKRGELAYVRDDGRFGYTLQTYGRRVDFVNVDQDYQEKGGTFLWSWLFSGAMRFYASAAYVKRSFESFDREDEDRGYGAGVTYRLNGSVAITMEGGRAERRSTVPLGSFVDTRVMLILGYSSGTFNDVRSRR